MGKQACFPLAVARSWADDLMSFLVRYCERVKIAGSVRRGKSEVGDVELVLVPKMAGKVNLAWKFLDRLTAVGILPEPSKAGPKYRCYLASSARPQLDLFAVTPPAQWGAILAIRTGPAEFSKGLVTALLRHGMRCQDGAVRKGNKAIPTSEETDFFALCGVPWTEPARRIALPEPGIGWRRSTRCVPLYPSDRTETK